MKHKTTVLLGLLVLANAGLWAAYLHRPETPRPLPTPVAATSPIMPPAPPVSEPAALWPQLQSDDPSRFAANLRGAGVPAATVRLLVSAQLRERYLARQRELFGVADPTPYGPEPSAPETREKLTALRTLAREQQELLRTLFGSDESETVARERQRRQYGPLSDEKLDQIDGIHADYDEIAEEIRRKAGGLLLPAEREALELLEQEKRKDIAAILTPAELEQYDLQTSPSARALRSRLAGFAPTEAEFRAIFSLQRAFDEKFAHRNGAGFDEGKAPDRAAAEQELETKLRTALGEGRFAEYRRQQDSGFRMAARIAERFGLPAQRAGEVYTLAQETQLRLQVLRSDRTLASEVALQALAALNRETNAKLDALLGAEGAEAYKQTSGGAWLRTMDRVVRPVVPVVPAAAALPAEPPAPAATNATPKPAPTVPSVPAAGG
jgi:hypothetical protein